MRMMNYGAALAALATLAACQPAVPDSGAGVGFGDYDSYQQAREAELQGRAASSLPAASEVSSQPLDATGGAISPAPAGTGGVMSPYVGPGGAPASARSDPMSTGSSAAEIAAETRAALNARAQNSGQMPVQASPANPAPEAVGQFGISQENDFSAVGEQRSIEQDKERLAQVRSEYQQIQPEALPQRTGSGPNIVAYALQTTNNPGQPVYRRMGIALQTRNQRNCAGFASPDLAQAEFLRRGGPDRDPKALDPDGDGFACSWDPRPFRAARGG